MLKYFQNYRPLTLKVIKEIGLGWLPMSRIPDCHDYEKGQRPVLPINEIKA
jgi:hypothetical protein